MKDKFFDIVNKNIKRNGIENLMIWLESSDFFSAPASTRFHECYEGGLVEHSLKVYRIFKHLTQKFNIGNDESVAICALFHDVCKVNTYKTELRWRKDDRNQWEQYPVYTFNESFKFGGHGSKSVFLLQNFITLQPDEAVAINCHMGVENGKWEVNDAFRDCPLAFLLHTADMMATIDYFDKEELWEIP